MPNVDFYLLNTASKQDSYRFLCRLVEKAYQQQNHAYIHTSSLEEAQCLDDLLWTFRDISFIPHQIGETSDALFPPSILIGTDKPKQQSADILFNLTQEAPPFFSQFSRIIEVVCEEKDHKIQARKKYKVYKEQNCPLTTHNISLPC
ncbi:DNA polymerase III subunit chi [Rickettsiella endosymbiont of Dermanyssus gallinae]|uniref:DNA polymerase III subunit chi n=1 Tax=Rickettsiella endosymbiont of Dermanyssus gallinae TaxID=2856608 RepID=UPI001C528ED3|nr:DNA polymerase III subunit chi [Rickettsiella endosymbiont of Dermanyssus gallinae]